MENLSDNFGYKYEMKEGRDEREGFFEAIKRITGVSMSISHTNWMTLLVFVEVRCTLRYVVRRVLRGVSRYSSPDPVWLAHLPHLRDRRCHGLFAARPPDRRPASIHPFGRPRSSFCTDCSWNTRFDGHFVKKIHENLFKGSKRL